MTTKKEKKPATKPATPDASKTYLPHKLAELVPGEMSSEEFDALCASIKEDGQQNPIMLYDNKILDGRHRYRACRKLSIAPKYAQFGLAVDAEHDKKAAAFVLDNNLHRRTLCSMQKALVAAHMHLDSQMPQKDAAVRVGVGVATVNLAVRLINSKNTPLIKRAENGDATRAEIDEILFDREASRQAQSTAGIQAPPPDTEDEEHDTPAPGNVVAFPAGNAPASNVGTKPSHPERHARETPASRVVQHFKALDDKARVAFVTMAWTWLAPALRNAGKLPTTAAPDTPSKAKKRKAA